MTACAEMIEYCLKINNNININSVSLKIIFFAPQT